MNNNDKISQFFEKIDAEKTNAKIAEAEAKAKDLKAQQEYDLAQKVMRERQEQENMILRNQFAEQITKWAPIIRLYLEGIGERWYPTVTYDVLEYKRHFLFFKKPIPKQVERKHYKLLETILLYDATFELHCPDEYHHEVTQMPRQYSEFKGYFDGETVDNLFKLEKGQRVYLKQTSSGLMCSYGVDETSTPVLVSEDVLQQLFSGIYDAGPQTIKRKSCTAI